jgi:hypothetical protein
MPSGRQQVIICNSPHQYMEFKVTGQHRGRPPPPFGTGEDQGPARGPLELWVFQGKPTPHTRARSRACLTPNGLHMRAMAGSSLKRARKRGVRLADGSIVAFPYMPRLPICRPAGGISRRRRRSSLIGLDRYEEILSWGPITDLDPLRLSFDAGDARLLADRPQGGPRRHARPRISPRA